MKIAVEPFTHELFSEIYPLAQKAWDECSEIKAETCVFHGERGFKIDPDVAQYELMASRGTLLLLTLREDDVLQGYCVSVLYRSLHHRVVPCANVDSFYLEPESRDHFIAFIAHIENEFRERGVVVIGWPTSGKLCEALKLLGYAPDDVVLEKKLCALQPEQQH